MKRGFMDFAATRIIPERPGETAEYYAREYLEVVGKDGSDATNPVQSLANTLRKRVGTGGEKRVRREKGRDGVYHYFPAGLASPGIDPEQKTIAVLVAVSPEELKILDDFVALGKFITRGDVLAWLAREGVKARQGDIEKAADIMKQIDSLKGSAPPL